MTALEDDRTSASEAAPGRRERERERESVQGIFDIKNGLKTESLASGNNLLDIIELVRILDSYFVSGKKFLKNWAERNFPCIQ